MRQTSLQPPRETGPAARVLRVLPEPAALVWRMPPAEARALLEAGPDVSDAELHGMVERLYSVGRMIAELVGRSGP